ncbi:MAG: DNA topoisomerase I [Thiothrix lacustris]|uniref:DNA topoisomerase 1 n=1 Tax=Thiothrix lacustris TaxID=525917 RepID=A0A1Y1QWM0_9GAMM|nr:MAG: DNA topoisomerase I [Thiothrix lacustris]
MSENLVIVESPAKGKTIQKYLGQGFEVLASYGHVRDLIPKEGAVDTANGYAMRYEIIDRNQKHVDAIARALKKADNLYLATDPDREGEAISWHLYELLNERGALKGKNVQRVVFHEITKRAVQEAIANPRDLAYDLVDAQQARRALDYLVGFNLSPLLWRKIKPSLSAGRVQSPALRLIVEREDEIERFVRQEYWTMTAQNAKNGQAFNARLHTLDSHKLDQFDINNEARATEVRERLLQMANGKLLVSKVDKKQRKRYPAPPFTTSTLQQEAVRKLKFSTQRAMRVAQQLYEGIDLGSGPVGLITYMRTDSVTLANEAIGELRGLIEQRYGQDKLPETPNFYKTKSKNAQEAHEAVRPTSAYRTPEQVKSHLNEEQFKLYELIWKRTVACQMIYATLDTVSADLTAAAGSFFRASGSTIRDAGFLLVYEEGLDDRASEKENPLPPLEEGENVTLNDIAAEQHFTEPPPRYSEASLVKVLEEYGIGRPSTYASIISTLLAREYVELESRRFTPTDIGRIVIRFLTEHFTQYVDYDFTANLENELDEISRGEKAWVPVMDAFWQPFHTLVDEKMESVNRSDVLQAREIGIDPTSGRPVSVRLGRFGPMVQIGTKDDEEKPVFAGLRPGMKLDTVTLDEALELFKLPRDLGETEDGKAISTNVGRFGAYVKYGDQFASLKKEDDPHTITLERALELIAEKKIKDAEKILVDFGNGVQILKGRWGPYINKVIKRVKVQARLPKDREPDSMTLEECEALIAVVAEAKTAKKGAKKAAAAPATESAEQPTVADTPAKPAKAKAAPKKAAAAKKPAAKQPTASKKAPSPKKSAS